MTMRYFRWQTFCSIAFCLMLSNVAIANPDIKTSLRLLSSPWTQNQTFNSFHPGKTVCSLAGPLIDLKLEETFTTISSVQPAQPAPPANALPVDIVVNQFSSPKFGQIGFTPQCLFVDHSTPRGYLETKIADTLHTSPNPIYDTSDLEVVQIPKSDPYWEYYSDCDTWNVTFMKLSERPIAHSPKKAGGRSTGQKIKRLAADGLEAFWDTLRNMEFIQVEMQGVKPRSQAQEFIIEGLKSIRPVLNTMSNRDLIFAWLESKQSQLESQLCDTSLNVVWNNWQYPHVYDLGQDEKPETSVQDGLQWIAERIEQVVNKIRIR